MNANQIGSTDAAALASGVRKFAALAHRAMKDPSFRDGKVDELSRQLAFLEGQFEGRSESELARWFERARDALGPLGT
jgi:hypothetical protein